MASDIVERLRRIAEHHLRARDHSETVAEAADEITALRARVAELEAELATWSEVGPDGSPAEGGAEVAQLGADGVGRLASRATGGDVAVDVPLRDGARLPGPGHLGDVAADPGDGAVRDGAAAGICVGAEHGGDGGVGRDGRLLCREDRAG